MLHGDPYRFKVALIETPQLDDTNGRCLWGFPGGASGKEPACNAGET